MLTIGLPPRGEDDAIHLQEKIALAETDRRLTGLSAGGELLSAGQVGLLAKRAALSEPR